MVDYLKLWVRDSQYQRNLLHNPEVSLSYNTTETIYKQKSKSTLQTSGSLRGMKLKLYHSGLTEISGSIHKYLNYDEHTGTSYNYDDFTLDRLTYAIDDITDTLELRADQLSIHNIEVGVNVNLDLPPQDYFDSVLNYKFRLPEVKYYAGNGHLLQWEYADYIVKNYNKQLQYQLSTPIIRFELKTLAMKHICKNRCLYLADLKQVENLLLLRAKLVEVFTNVMYIESVPKCQLTAKEWAKYQNYINRLYWRDLRKQVSRNQLKVHKQTYYKLIDRTICQPLYKTVLDSIENKFDMLLNNQRQIL